MKFDDIQEFIRIAKEEGVKELNYEQKDFKVSVRLPVEADTQVVHQPVASPPATPSHSRPKEVSAEEGNYVSVTCPFVGTFYRAPSPGSDPYAQVGDKVRKGQVLCIVEAMKIMNEIESEADGEIVDICVENENYVEYGEVLFKIKPS